MNSSGGGGILMTLIAFYFVCMAPKKQRIVCIVKLTVDKNEKKSTRRPEKGGKLKIDFPNN